ncbi:hypothetical protein PHYBLDRAFT_145804 [Phycomyces blakesleeanus NRRL 1555(-)]|uniref:Uncharacterized protein n=1 Tax=Phycomyces blakesleeanus (strain ATCC 8743b / DSM 1359 / FGSC 10004 / NBRC 33097 / NRRL 1555) TaxID=763407 RepID=A0A163DU20_PHYB8|nr:hypothetical protein PHYBLDRAFT_145804 [Phycomyces blakesleeanus NRRL 1555(-)]OAD73410.1 hypothetical protein PHYBLDRAFT_145804 [Phycomyces blakesleeanus NRRL 1555(-)]|eukprot:XP_018291450.1 hypothetical protein PHYBLDRAFT_145804 [Phycomyces blakesleeanus NRRL 1555(-)]
MSSLIAAQCFLVHVFSVFYAQRPFHCSHGEVLHVKFMYQFRFAFKHKYFLNPTQLSASTSTFQAFRSCLLVFKGMLMERCTENQLSIFTPFAWSLSTSYSIGHDISKGIYSLSSLKVPWPKIGPYFERFYLHLLQWKRNQKGFRLGLYCLRWRSSNAYQQVSSLHSMEKVTGGTLDIGSPDFVLRGMSRLSQKAPGREVMQVDSSKIARLPKLDMRDEPEAKLRCLSKCYAVHLGVSDTCPEQFGIKAFHRYFAVMVNLMPCRVGRNEGC